MAAAHRYQRQLSDARRRQLNKRRKHMYKLQLHNYSGSIRPHKQGNWTRFINHSSQSPNCRCVQYGEKRTRTTTRRRTRPHTQQYSALLTTLRWPLS
jgi:SET domain-containing protein